MEAHRSKKIDRSLKDRHLIKLEYDFGEPQQADVTSDDLFDLLYEMREAAASDVKNIPYLFSKCVQHLRSLSTELIKEAYDKVKTCTAEKCDRKTKVIETLKTSASDFFSFSFFLLFEVAV